MDSANQMPRSMQIIGRHPNPALVVISSMALELLSEASLPGQQGSDPDREQKVRGHHSCLWMGKLDEGQAHGAHCGQHLLQGILFQSPHPSISIQDIKQRGRLLDR